LDTEGPLTALTAAMSFYQEHSINTKGLIHHSDRGCQYASQRYVTFLKENDISISMTQDGDPLHNALAERMNNTLKNEWIFNNGILSFEQAQTAVARAIEMYNSARPHQALQMRTPLHLVKTCHKNPLT
jgi:transposase InsO family protein